MPQPTPSQSKLPAELSVLASALSHLDLYAYDRVTGELGRIAATELSGPVITARSLGVVPVPDQDADNSEVPDATAALQARIDELDVKRGGPGGRIAFEDGRYAIRNLIWRGGVAPLGAGRANGKFRYEEDSSARIGTTFISAPGTGSTMVFSGERSGDKKKITRVLAQGFNVEGDAADPTNDCILFDGDHDFAGTSGLWLTQFRCVGAGRRGVSVQSRAAGRRNAPGSSFWDGRTLPNGAPEFPYGAFWDNMHLFDYEVWRSGEVGILWTGQCFDCKMLFGRVSKSGSHNVWNQPWYDPRTETGVETDSTSVSSHFRWAGPSNLVVIEHQNSEAGYNNATGDLGPINHGSNALDVVAHGIYDQGATSKIFPVNAELCGYGDSTNSSRALMIESNDDTADAFGNGRIRETGTLVLGLQSDRHSGAVEVKTGTGATLIGCDYNLSGSQDDDRVAGGVIVSAKGGPVLIVRYSDGGYGDVARAAIANGDQTATPLETVNLREIEGTPFSVTTADFFVTPAGGEHPIGAAQTITGTTATVTMGGTGLQVPLTDGDVVGLTTDLRVVAEAGAIVRVIEPGAPELEQRFQSAALLSAQSKIVAGTGFGLGAVNPAFLDRDGNVIGGFHVTPDGLQLILAMFGANLIRFRNGLVQVNGEFQVDSGLVELNNLPTTNPGIPGRLWNDGGTLKIV